MKKKYVFTFVIKCKEIIIVPCFLGTIGSVDVDGVTTRCLYNEDNVLSFIETDLLVIEQISELKIPVTY
jgi:hypothetical protein